MHRPFTAVQYLHRLLTSRVGYSSTTPLEIVSRAVSCGVSIGEEVAGVEGLEPGTV